MKHNWEYKRLGEICDILDSQRRPVTKSDRKPGPYPYYGASGVQDYVSDYIFDGDYLLVGEDGAKWGANEKSAFSISGKTWVNNHAHILDFKKSPVSQKFVEYILCGSDLNKIITGTVVPKLTQKNLISVLIPVPPRAVQEQIVAELDKINEVIEDSRELLRNLDALAQSLFYDIFGDPITNPKGFLQKSMGEFASVKIGPFGSLLHKEDYVCGGTPLVNPIHMQNGMVKIDNDFTIDDTKKKVLLNYLLKSGDIVFGRRGDIGRCALITDNEDGYLCGTGSLFVRFNIKINPLFALWCCRQRSVTAYLTEKAKGATMLNINCGIIESAPIILPPLPLQEQFSARIEQIEAEKKTVEETIANLQLLLDSRMDYWFND